MRDILWNVLTDVVVMPITFVIGLFIAKIKFILHLNAYKKVLKIKEDTLDIACYTANTRQRDDEELVELGYIFEYMALGEIRSVLPTIYKEVNVTCKMSRLNFQDIKKVNFKKHMILIGGPFHNAITNHFFFEKEGMIPFEFDAASNLIYKPTQVRYTPRIREGEDNYVEKDYALILNVRNPLCEGKRILAIIGCRSIGCYGGAVFLARRIAGIKKDIKDEEYAVVVECEGEEDNIIDQPKYISYYPLNYAEVYAKANQEIDQQEYGISPQTIEIQF